MCNKKQGIIYPIFITSWALWRNLSTSGNQRDNTARLLAGHGPRQRGTATCKMAKNDFASVQQFLALPLPVSLLFFL
jgi:hypothetical protein